MKTEDVRITGYYTCSIDGVDQLVRVLEQTTVNQTSARTWRTRKVPAFKVRISKDGRIVAVTADRLKAD